jgi:hypothetical protein
MNQIDILFNSFEFIATNAFTPLRRVCSLWKEVIDMKLMSANNNTICSMLFKNHFKLIPISNTSKIKGNVLKYDLLSNGFLVVLSHYFDCLSRKYFYVFNVVDHTGLIHQSTLRSTENYELFIYSDFILDTNLNIVKIQMQTCMMVMFFDYFFNFYTFEFDQEGNTFYHKIDYRIEMDKWGLYDVIWYESSVLNRVNNYCVHLGRQGYLKIYEGGKPPLNFNREHYQTQNDVAYFYGLLLEEKQEFILIVKSYPECTFKVENFYIFQQEENVFYKPLFVENDFNVVKIKKSKSTIRFVLLNQK